MSNQYDDWIGRKESLEEEISAQRVAALAATLDIEHPPLGGQPLPPGWQWLFFNPFVIRRKLGEDGHPQRGGFLPPIELPRRMWAGSRIQYLASVLVGDLATRSSLITKIENKVGKRGSLWFVTVQHTISQNGQSCIVEEQDIVYREAAAPGNAPAPVVVPPRYDREPTVSQRVTPDTTLLFRYSALTSNGHRIHYDQAYAREVEAYPDLVVHGPLTATLLQQFALSLGQGKPLARFEFRGVSPLFVSDSFSLESAAADGSKLDLWARGPHGELAMSAVAEFGVT